MLSMKVIQIDLSSLRDPILRHINRWVSILVLDKLEDSPKPKWGDLEPEGARSKPGTVMSGSSTSESESSKVRH